MSMPHSPNVELNFSFDEINIQDIPHINADKSPSPRILDITFGKKPRNKVKLPSIDQIDWKKDYKIITNEPTTVTAISLRNNVAKSNRFRSGEIADRISLYERQLNNHTLEPVSQSFKLENKSKRIFGVESK